MEYQNAQAHQLAVERANERTRQSSGPAPAPVFPLAILARMLIAGPPSLSRLCDLMENSEVFAAFLELVREYLPEYEARIMAEDVDHRIGKFCDYFERHYFPLSDNIEFAEYTLSDFLLQIPVDLMGFSYDDFHEFMDFRAGYTLLLSLVESPFVDDNDGGRVSLLEQVDKLVGKGLIELIPPEGWKLVDLHRMLDGTQYDGVAAFADWINANTGCWQLDATYDGYDGERWTREVVDRLTEQWPRVVDIQNNIQHISEWLEEDLRANFRELLAHLLNRKDLIIPKEQLALPLDENGQVIGKEVIVDGNE